MLTLRPFRSNDRLILESHLADPTITAALPDYSTDDLAIWVSHILSDKCSYAIELDGNMVGACRLEQNPHSDFSYWLHRDYRGRGLADLVNHRLCRMAISLGWKTISGFCDPSNIPSQTVLRRCGFTEHNNRWTKSL